MLLRVQVSVDVRLRSPQAQSVDSMTIENRFLSTIDESKSFIVTLDHLRGGFNNGESEESHELVDISLQLEQHLVLHWTVDHAADGLHVRGNTTLSLLLPFQATTGRTIVVSLWEDEVYTGGNMKPPKLLSRRLANLPRTAAKTNNNNPISRASTMVSAEQRTAGPFMVLQLHGATTCAFNQAHVFDSTAEGHVFFLGRRRMTILAVVGCVTFLSAFVWYGQSWGRGSTTASPHANRTTIARGSSNDASGTLQDAAGVPAGALQDGVTAKSGGADGGDNKHGSTDTGDGQSNGGEVVGIHATRKIAALPALKEKRQLSDTNKASLSPLMQNIPATKRPAEARRKKSGTSRIHQLHQLRERATSKPAAVATDDAARGSLQHDAAILRSNGVRTKSARPTTKAVPKIYPTKTSGNNRTLQRQAPPRSLSAGNSVFHLQRGLQQSETMGSPSNHSEDLRDTTRYNGYSYSEKSEPPSPDLQKVRRAERALPQLDVVLHATPSTTGGSTNSDNLVINIPDNLTVSLFSDSSSVDSITSPKPFRVGDVSRGRGNRRVSLDSRDSQRGKRQGSISSRKPKKDTKKRRSCSSRDEKEERHSKHRRRRLAKPDDLLLSDIKPSKSLSAAAESVNASVWQVGSHSLE